MGLFSWFKRRPPTPTPPPEQPPLPPLGPITVQGIEFYRNGEPWIYKGATNFMLPLRYMMGEDISPVLYPGAEVYVCLGLARWIPEQMGYRHLTPDDDSYYTRLGELADYLAERRKLMEFAALADVEGLRLPLDWCIRHWEKCVDVLGQKDNVLIRLVNEPWNRSNNPYGKEPFRYRPGLKALLNRGDLADHELRRGDHWDWCSNHPRRDHPKHLKNCQMTDVIEPVKLDDGRYGVGKPIVINEPLKAADFTDNTKNYSDPKVFYKAGCLMRSGNGGAFHSVDGVYSRPLSENQERCREAFFKGLG